MFVDLQYFTLSLAKTCLKTNCFKFIFSVFTGSMMFEKAPLKFHGVVMHTL